MRIDIPVISCAEGRLIRDSAGNVNFKNKTGDVTWTYRYANHKGIGIAACARSGTVYIKKVLEQLGYSIGHERMGEDGSVGYHLALVKPKNCFHQVREPIKQINSMYAHKSWGWCHLVMKSMRFDLLDCMRYWLVWNEMIEDFAVWRYRIEDLPGVWDEFCDRIGHEHCELPDVPTDTNKLKKPEAYMNFQWSDLFNENKELACRIYDKAIDYGYSPEKDKEEPVTLGERGAAQVVNSR